MERAQDSSDRVDDLSWRFITFILTAGTLFIAGLGVWSWRKASEFEKENDKIREQSEQVNENLEDMRLKLCDARYMSASLMGDMFAEKNLKRKAQSKYKDALAILDEVLKENCHPEFLHEKTIVLNKLGDIQVEYGNFKEARRYYQESQDEAMRLIKSDEDNLEYQRDLLFSYKKIGDMDMKRGDMNRARQSLEQALLRIDNLIKILHGGDLALIQHDQNAVLRKLGAVVKERGDMGKALQYIDNAMEVANDLLDKDASYVKWQRDRMLSLMEKAKILQDMGSVNSALETCKHALQSADELLSKDFDNVERLFDRSTILGVLTSIEMKRGDLSSAEVYCNERMQIVDHLVKQDGYNTQWQKEQSAALKAMGDVWKECGQYDSAEKQYRNALNIAENLVELDGSNWQWQSDLRASLNDLANLLQARNKGEDWKEAEGCYRHALKIANELVKKDGSNAQWKRGLSGSLNNLANLLQARSEGGDRKEAENCYRHALKISDELVKNDESNAQRKRDLWCSWHNLGNLLQASNEDEDWKESEGCYRSALKIAERLVEKDGSNAQWQGDLWMSLNNLGNLLQARNEGEDRKEAEGCYRRALEIAEKLVKMDGSNVQWQRDLMWSLRALGFLFLERGEEGDAEEAEALFARAQAISDTLDES